MRINIDLGAYGRNLIRLQGHLSPSALMAVVKDDAYGHGIERIVPAALEAGVTKFAVLDIATGTRVRALVPEDVQLFAWLFSAGDDFAEAIRQGIDLGVSHPQVLSAIARSEAGVAARVHLKIDSGLHRNGSSFGDWSELVEQSLEFQAAGLIDVVGVWTHIGEASPEEDAKSQAIFDEAVLFAEQAGLRIVQRHLAASAAAFERPEFRYDFCRVGGFTYGIAPGDGVGPQQVGLEAVMSAHAFVVDVSGRDGTGTVRIESGFLDGIPDWNVGSGEPGILPVEGFEVTYNGQRLPILEVNSSYMVIDARNAPILSLGKEVVLFGSHLRNEVVLQEWADALGTVGEEIVVRVGPHSEKTYD